MEITPEELYAVMVGAKNTLVNNTIDTMFIAPTKKKIENLLFLLKIMAQLLSVSTMVLEKNGYNVDTEKKTLDYVYTLLKGENKHE